MRIRFETGGGIAGAAARRSIEVDTEKLPPDEVAHLQSLVERANLPELATRSSRSGPDPRPDETYSEITLEEHGATHNLSLSGIVLPAQLKPLVAWLNERAVKGMSG